MLAISYPEAVQKKRPNYYIKRIKCTTMLASKKTENLYTLRTLNPVLRKEGKGSSNLPYDPRACV